MIRSLGTTQYNGHGFRRPRRSVPRIGHSEFPTKYPYFIMQAQQEARRKSAKGAGEPEAPVWPPRRKNHKKTKPSDLYGECATFAFRDLIPNLTVLLTDETLSLVLVS